MQFVQLEGTPLADHFEFFRTRFPNAFKQSPGEGQQPEWTSSQHRDAFKTFDQEVLQAKNKSNYLALLQILLKLKSQIVELPQKPKKDNFTLSRFVLYLMPVFQLSIKNDAKKTNEIFSDLVSLVVSCDVHFSHKINSLLYMYNATSNGMKAQVFKAMVQLCQKEGQLEILIQKARNVVQETETWTLTPDERKDLYLSVAQSLDAVSDDAAFGILHAYLKQFEGLDNQSSNVIESHARRCVILAIKSCSVINFEELLNMKAIKQLESVSCNPKITSEQKNKEVFKLLSLFSETDAKEFKKQLGQFSKLMQAENLSEEEVIKKKSYVQICSLVTDKTNFSYEELSGLLNIEVGDVEEWAIEAITKRIMDAKIDQEKHEIVIKSHQLKDVRRQEWEVIQNKVRCWRERFERMSQVLTAANEMEKAAKQ